jgi:hypothetical protein
VCGGDHPVGDVVCEGEMTVEITPALVQDFAEYLADVRNWREMRQEQKREQAIKRHKKAKSRLGIHTL